MCTYHGKTFCSTKELLRATYGTIEKFLKTRYMISYFAREQGKEM
jgi:hypothetical protein